MQNLNMFNINIYVYIPVFIIESSVKYMFNIHWYISGISSEN